MASVAGTFCLWAHLSLTVCSSVSETLIGDAVERQTAADLVRDTPRVPQSPFLWPGAVTHTLEPPLATEGGGLQGGTSHHGQDREPAPPMHFPPGCHWREPKRLAFVHVGKAAGSSMERMLMRAPVNFTHAHGSFAREWFEPEDYDLYVVCTRDPIDRVVSAFNFNHPNGGQGSSFSMHEREMYRCFQENPGGVNAFAESLDSNSPCGRAARRCLHSPSAACSHITQNFQFYLGMGLGSRAIDVLHELRENPRKRALLVSTQNFSADMAAVWDWLCVPPQLRPADEHTNSADFPRHNDTYLSPRGRDLLRRHLARDRFALEELMLYADNGNGNQSQSWAWSLRNPALGLQLVLLAVVLVASTVGSTEAWM